MKLIHMPNIHIKSIFYKKKIIINMIILIFIIYTYNIYTYIYVSFTEITHRFQTARREVRQLLLQYLLPWLHNMELVDPNVPPPSNPLSYYQVNFIDFSFI